MSDPATLMGEVEADCRALDACGKELGRALKELAEAEIASGDAFDAALIEVEREYAGRDERLPSAEQRAAHARQKIEPELRGKAMRLKREVEALQHWARIKQASVSGRQSILSTLKAELGAGS